MNERGPNAGSAMTSQALYYPWIDIRDETWLKTSLLYWDSVRTIVPESIDEPYSNETARALQSEGFLVPLRVHSRMRAVEDLAGDVMAYMNTSEGLDLLLGRRDGRRHRIHTDKLPSGLRRLADIHPDKLPNEIRDMLSRIAQPSDPERPWLAVDEGFALFYMTLLARQLAERVGAALLTPLPAAERVATMARLDAHRGGLVPWGRHGPRRAREYDAFGPRRHLPRTLAPGLLAHLAIQRVAVSPDTPIDKLLKFKEAHQDELAQFRTKIDELASAVGDDLPLEALRQRVADLHKNEVRPAITNLKRALRGRRIRAFSEGLLKVAGISTGPCALLAVAGLSIPHALLAAAGLSLVASSVLYSLDKGDTLRANPYSYLLSAEKELGP